MTQYCGVSHVPSIVGVVSGRVVRYYGQLHDKTTMNQFLEDILPPSIVNSVSMFDDVILLPFKLICMHTIVNSVSMDYIIV